MSGLLRNEQFTALIPTLARDLGSVKAALILQFLHFRADEDGSTTATLDQIAAGLGCARRTVQTHLAVLHEDGILSSQRSSFSNATKTYRIHTEVIATLHVAETANLQVAEPATLEVAETATLQVAETATSLSTKEGKNPPTPRKRGASDLPPGFEQWWKRYPRKTAKIAATKAYRSALTQTTPDALLAALEAQRDGLLDRDERFRPHPATWLRSGMWADEALVEESSFDWQARFM